ncbi:hypothetical protein [Paenibacillus dauci]|uniref:hypothetical protein n=1 Tax=Paenibacillus dauci TaxID=1567106 RepID=UPI0006197422|nr:hypothetical protein [Paenibacillus dauci]
MTRHPLDHPDQREYPQANHTAEEHDQDAERHATDQAWQNMQALLTKEIPHPNWEKWSDPSFKSKPDKASANLSNPRGMNAIMNPIKPNDQQEPQRQESPATKSSARRNKMNPVRRRWVTGIAACVVAGVVITTPFGNNALAALLGQFRMQEITTVNDNDLDQMFDRYKESGMTDENMNRFGTFTDTTGKVEGLYYPKKAAEMLGYTDLSKMITEKDLRVGVHPSRTSTVRMNIDEVNKAIQQLGGDTLLPESMNQKPISIKIPESITYPLSPEDSSTDENTGLLTQMGLPSVEFDPSINTEEAFNAIMNLPFLPESVKTMLQKEKVLKGELPLPVISNARIEKVTIGGIPVIIGTQNYDNQDGDNVTNYTNYTAYWIKDNQLFMLDGDIFYSREALIKKAEELIKL